MALLSDEAKRDIAHKFDLPERRSKIASMIKQSEELYCICRTADSTRFMIACDSCEEWFHGDCMNMTKADAAMVKRYYCPPCIAANSGLKPVYKKARITTNKTDLKADKTFKETVKRKRGGLTSRPAPIPKKVLTDKKQTKCFCDGCHRTKNCGKCTGCNRYEKKCIERRCTYKKGKSKLSDEDFDSSDLSDSDASENEIGRWSPVQPKGRAQKEVKKKPIRKPPAKGGKRQAGRRKAVVVQKPIKESSSDDEYISEFTKAPRQCQGPGCTEQSRPDSKYCKDYCGISLAYARIYAILPSRLTEWHLTPCVAEAHNKAENEYLQKKYIEAQEELKDLVSKRYAVDKHIEHVREVELNSDSSEDEEEEEGVIYCVSCGHEISMKTCIKHMEKCFNKQEGKTTYCSGQRAYIDGPPLFCDTFNPANKTYCKKLAVLCMEHFKQPKIGEKELCGFPVDELTNTRDPFGKFCRVRKKRCNKHFSWERLRRASIDMQRLQKLTKCDEYLDKDYKLKSAQQNRGSLMCLLLNSTFDHEIREGKTEKLMELGGKMTSHEEYEDEEEDDYSSS